jgi:cysteinyl-tRNA synthetase
VIRAGAAPGRPVGLAEGTSGHGGGVDVALSDRAYEPSAPLSPSGRTLHDRFVAAIDDDLDLPSALTIVREVARGSLPVDERRWLVLDADGVLGLGLDGVWASAPAAEVPEEVRTLVADRSSARAAGDYERADAIRSDLADRGWDVVDSGTGSTVQARPVASATKR